MQTVHSQEYYYEQIQNEREKAQQRTRQTNTQINEHKHQKIILKNKSERRERGGLEQKGLGELGLLDGLHLLEL